MGGYYADSALFNDLVDDNHALIVDVLAVLAGDFQVRHTGAIGEKKEHILWRTIGDASYLTRCRSRDHRIKAGDEVQTNAQFSHIELLIQSLSLAKCLGPKRAAAQAIATGPYSRRERSARQAK